MLPFNVNKKKVVPDLIFFTAQRRENISFIFSLLSFRHLSERCFCLAFSLN